MYEEILFQKVARKDPWRSLTCLHFRDDRTDTPPEGDSYLYRLLPSLWGQEVQWK